MPTELVDVEYWPHVDISAAGGSAEIGDCLIVTARPADQPDAEPTARSQVWTGIATKANGGRLAGRLVAAVRNGIGDRSAEG